MLRKNTQISEQICVLNSFSEVSNLLNDNVLSKDLLYSQK